MKHRFPSLLLILCLLFAACPLAVSAEEAKVVLAFSASSLKVGDTVTVTAKFSADSVGSVNGILSYDSDLLTFVSGDNAAGEGGIVRFTSWATSEQSALSFSFVFRAVKAGSALIRVESSTVYSWQDEHIGGPTAGARMAITPVETQAANANLGSLSLSAGKLSPAFSPSVTAYSVSVAHTVTSLTVSAKAADQNATVKVSGSNELQVGQNKRTITVTAQNGTIKTYTLTITRAAQTTASTAKPTTTKPSTTKPTTTTTPTTTSTPTTTTTTALETPDAPDPVDPLLVTMGDRRFRVAASLAGQALPEGFIVAEQRFREQVVEGAVSEGGGLVLLLLTDTADETQIGEWYLYDDETDRFSPFITLAATPRTYILLPFPDDCPDDLREDTWDLGGQTVTVRRFADEERAAFCLLYAAAADGAAALYCYDTEAGTLQRYIAPPAATTVAVANPTTAVPTTAAKPAEPSALPWMLFVGAALFAVILLVMLIVSHRAHRVKPRH